MSQPADLFDLVQSRWFLEICARGTLKAKLSGKFAILPVPKKLFRPHSLPVAPMYICAAPSGLVSVGISPLDAFRVQEELALNALTNSEGPSHATH